jgi:hypothetical protein
LPTEIYDILADLDFARFRKEQQPQYIIELENNFVAFTIKALSHIR